ncbi:hypothetical protein WICPIJ_003978 [Wickerhamomyces pijperi]|uniref:RRM domain-containing protein n=1 Tax=Wickerhamomyces pijperi TaxID=599730 RepID=A0A9P8TNQ3_WICPI|nr:hypothetical protein WICPIJ_003978 [Wickerhamomyces pijperi]
MTESEPTELQLTTFLSEDDILEKITELDEQLNTKQTFRSLISLLKSQETQETDDHIDYSDFITLIREKFHTWCVLDYEDYQSWIHDISTKEQYGDVQDLKRVYELMEEDHKDWMSYSKLFQSLSAENDQSLPFDEEETRSLLNRARANTKFDFLHSRSIFLQIVAYHSKDTELLKELYIEQLSIPHSQIELTFQEYSSFISSQYPQNLYQVMMKSADSIYQRTMKLMDSTEEAWRFVQQVSAEDHTEPIGFDQWIQLMKFQHSSIPKKFRHANRLLPVLENAILYHNGDLSGLITVWLTYLSHLYEYSQYPITSTVTDYDRLINQELNRFIRCHPSRLIPLTETLKYHSDITIDKFEDLKQRSELILDNYRDSIEMRTYDDYHEWKNFHVSLLEYHVRVFQRSMNSESLETLKTVGTELFRKSMNQYELDPGHTVVKSVLSIYEKQMPEDKVRELYKELTSTFQAEADGWINWIQFEKRLSTKENNIENLMKVINSSLNKAHLISDSPDLLLEEVGLILSEFEYLLRSDMPRLRCIRSKCWKCWRELENRRLLEQVEAIDVEEASEQETSTNKRPLSEEPESVEPVKRVKVHATTEPHKNRESNLIQVTNIPLATTSDQIRQFFDKCGEILELTIHQDTATLLFDSEHSVLRAITRDHKPLNGSSVRVGRLEGNIIWVANYPADYTKSQLMDLFQDIDQGVDTSIVQSIRFPTLKTNTHRRFCYITYQTSQQAQSAVSKYHGTVINGFELVVKISNPNEKTERNDTKRRRDASDQDNKSIFIRNLDFYGMNEEKLREIFSKFGNIESVRVPLKPEFNNKRDSRVKVNNGFAFIRFETADEAINSVQEMDQRLVNGRSLHVSIAESKSKDETPVNQMDSSNELVTSPTSVLLKNVPDTYTAAELTSFIQAQIPELSQSEYEIEIHPNLQSSVIKCSTSQTAGLISLRLEGVTIQDLNDPSNGKVLSIGDVKELKSLQYQYSQLKNKNKNVSLMVPNRLQRRKMMREAAAAANCTEDSNLRTEPVREEKNTSNDQIELEKGSRDEVKTTKPKSNSDFRALFLSSLKK